MALDITHLIVGVAVPLIVYFLQKRGIVPTPSTPATPDAPVPAPAPAPLPLPTEPAALAALLQKMLDALLKVHLHQAGVAEPAAAQPAAAAHQVTLPISLSLSPVLAAQSA